MYKRTIVPGKLIGELIKLQDQRSSKRTAFKMTAIARLSWRIAPPMGLIHPSPAATTADNILAPRVGSPWTDGSSELTEQLASPANNDRLAELTEPASTAAPQEPETTT